MGAGAGAGAGAREGEGVCAGETGVAVFNSCQPLCEQGGSCGHDEGSLWLNTV